MSKRKLDISDFDVNELIKNNNYKLYNYYNNPTNCDVITLCDNHIYFNACINNETISKLILYIQSIIGNLHLIGINKSIYLHINTKGGVIYALNDFIAFKKLCSIEIISIIENDCADAGIIIASLCNYRIINKNAFIKLTNYNPSYTCPNYWNYFKQCENNSMELENLKKNIYYIFCELIDSKITNEKLTKYLQSDRLWDAKKCKKLGLIDEII